MDFDLIQEALEALLEERNRLALGAATEEFKTLMVRDIKKIQEQIQIVKESK